jgi:hypothetical protein
MPKRWVQLIGVFGIVSLSYVIFSIVSQAPKDRLPIIIFALIVLFISICVVAYTMITGRRRSGKTDRAK